MPGKQVKNWPKYHRLRDKGMTKRQAAMTANAQAKKRRRKKRGS